MLKKMTAALQQWLSPAKTADGQGVEPTEDSVTARRGFFKKAALGAVSLSGTAGLAKVVVDSTPEPDLQALYEKDRLTGEEELRKREYVLMSDKEKEDMVQTFVDSYHGRALKAPQR